jgi:hypothetical protein
MGVGRNGPVGHSRKTHLMSQILDPSGEPVRGGDDAPGKIQVDNDWKAQAQAEKQKLAEQAKQRESAPAASGSPGSPGPAGGPAGATGGVPAKADMEGLVSTMAMQALFAMGAIPDPATGQRVAHLDLARHHIDLLTVLEDKTAGNLTDDESKMLSGTLYELRSRYVQLAQSARDQTLGRSQDAPGSAPGRPAGPPSLGN